LRLEVLLAESQAVFRHGRNGKFRELGTLDLTGLDEAGQRGAVAGIVKSAAGRAGEVMLRIPRAQVLRRRVELPLAAAENLREVLSFEMDRNTPFQVGEVYFDYRMTGRDTAAKRMTVELAVVTRKLADEAVARLSSWGLPPDRLDVEPDTAPSDAGFNLLPRSAVRSAGRDLRRFTVAMAAAACVLLAVVFYLPIQQKERVLAAAEARLAAARGQALGPDRPAGTVGDAVGGAFQFAGDRGPEGRARALQPLGDGIPGGGVMNAALPRWVSRLAALALLIAVLGAVYLYGVMPLFAAYRDIDAEIEGAEELLAGFERIAARRQTYEDQLETLGRRQTGVGIYLSGTTNALAAADLQDRVKDAVEANGGQLRSIQILPEKADGAFTRVSVRVQLTANMAGFHRILYSLESGKPFIFVDNLDVRNRRARRRAALQDVDPVLTVRFDLLGYLRPGVG
jgi:hypothetical protein